MMFNTTFNNISAISWRSVLLVEESGVAGENHHRYLSIELGRNYYFWHSYRPISIGDYKLHQLNNPKPSTVRASFV
jgi:hypothetical protein